MLSKESFTSSATISLDDLFCISTNQFLIPFEPIVDLDIHKGIYLDFEIGKRVKKDKVSPILRLARPEDATGIVEIYKELYHGTYPYKEMENEREVRKMIQDSSIEWVIFQDPSYNLAGCITFILDFENKRGYIRGFMLKKQYQGYIDITKAMIGSMIGMCHKYKKEIYVWYVENRTAHAKYQYSMLVCGIAPIGFYPNKDIFLGKVESDLMQVLYEERALREYRTPQVPQVLPEIEMCFNYSNKRYNLGKIEYIVPDLHLNSRRIKLLKEQLKITTIEDKFQYQTITFSFKDSDSYFKFLYTPSVKNFEKTEYKVCNLEELYVFVQEFMAYQERFNVRYSEIFLSAYNPSHQKIFLDAGFKPRGYIPSWKFNKEKNCFEDSILFNCFKGRISDDIQLIKEAQELLKYLNLAPYKIPLLSSYKFIEKVIDNPFSSKIKQSFESANKMKQCLKVSLMIYIFLLLISYILATPFGYNPFIHTISGLGTIYLTPLPFIFDSACIFGGILNILLIFLLGKEICRSIQTSQECRKYYALLNTGIILNIFGALSYSLIGLFSLDRAGPYGSLHGIFAIFAFLGFTLSIVLISLLILLLASPIPKYLGLGGLIFPLFICGLNCIFAIPILEWILLCSILLFLVPTYFKVLQNK